MEPIEVNRVMEQREALREMWREMILQSRDAADWWQRDDEDSVHVSEDRE